MKTLSIALTLVLVSGCIVGPNFRTPRPMIEQEWHTPSSEVLCVQEEVLPTLDWWECLHDPLLNALIAQAADQNHDVAAAEWRVVVARASRQAAAAPYFPQITGDVNASRTGFSKNGPIAEFQGTVDPTTAMPSIQRPLFQNLYNFNFDASWELDLFGKTYRTVEAAEARVKSAMETRNDILLSLLAEVARTYGEIRGNQTQWELQKANVALLEELHLLRQERLDSGLDTGIDLDTIEAEQATAASFLPDLESQITQGIYALSVLVGEEPQTLYDALACPQPFPHVLNEVFVGLRSDCLRQRPDVRKAEQELHAATAEIGVAIADFFPSFSLFGFLGLQSLMPRNWLQLQSNTWSYGANLGFPVFQGGALTAQLRAKRAEAEAVFESYKQIVLRALQEAESALVSYAKKGETRRDLEKKVERLRSSRDLAHQQWDVGLTNGLEFLNIERELLLSEQELTDVETAQFIDLIALYKALGGGWQIF